MNKNITVVNSTDKEFYEGKCFEISLHNYDNEFFHIYASHEQQALDILVDWMEETEQTGYLYTLDDLNEEYNLEEIENDFIVGGNHCYYLIQEHTWIKEVE